MEFVFVSLFLQLEMVYMFVICCWCSTTCET